jgi:hypothetical protein
MRTLGLAALLGITFLAFSSARASELEVTVRHHARRITCGDPVYLEVTIANRGKAPILALPATSDLATFRFELRDENSGLVLWQNGAGHAPEGTPFITYEPGQPVAQYFQLFLPPLGRSNDPFWKPVCQRGEVLVAGVYRIKAGKGGAGVEVRSGWQPVNLDEPEDDPFAVFARYANDKSEPSEKGPVPADFGLSSRGIYNRSRTAEVAAAVTSPELADLLGLTMRMQQLYALPDAERGPKNAALRGWLEGLPDIKRQYLTRRTHEVALGYKMRSTAETLAELVEEMGPHP